MTTYLRRAARFLLAAMILFLGTAWALAQTNAIGGSGAATVGGTASVLMDAGVIIAPLMLLGAILKNAFPTFPNRFIPLLTWVLGTGGYLIRTGDWTRNGVMTAVLAATSATGLHSGIKNTFESGEAGAAVSAAAEKVGLWLLVCGLCFAVGCAGSFATRTFRAEETMTDGVAQSVRGMGAWYKMKTNGASPQEIESLTGQWNRVVDAQTNYANAILEVEEWRAVYVTNATVKPALEAAMAAASARSSNIVWLVGTFRTAKPQTPNSSQ